MRHLFYIFALLFIITFLGCSKTPGDVIPPHKMARLLADMHKGEGAVDLNRRDFYTDSSKMALMEAIYKRHGVSQEMVDTSFDWYGHHIDEYINVYTEVMEILQAEIDQTDAVATRIQMAAIGDSANTWNFSPRYIISDKTPEKTLTLILTPDDNWQKGDNYTLNFKAMNNTSPIRSVLGVEYEDGDLEWIENVMTETGKATYNLVTDSTRNIRKVFNNIMFKPASQEIIFIDSLSLMRTRVNRQTYSRRYSQRKLSPKMTGIEASNDTVTNK